MVDFHKIWGGEIGLSETWIKSKKLVRTLYCRSPPPRKPPPSTFLLHQIMEAPLWLPPFWRSRVARRRAPRQLTTAYMLTAIFCKKKNTGWLLKKNWKKIGGKGEKFKNISSTGLTSGDLFRNKLQLFLIHFILNSIFRKTEKIV